MINCYCCKIDYDFEKQDSRMYEINEWSFGNTLSTQYFNICPKCKNCSLQEIFRDEI